MLILLPPSEGKRAPASGPTLQLESLSRPGLTEARTQVLEALIATSGRPDARAMLGVPARALEQARANLVLRSAPAGPAAEVYSGVLYEALGLGTLPDDARARAASSVLVFSALFGILQPDDRIPAYRLGAGARLVGVGPVRAWWRAALRGVDLGDGLIVDARSGEYAGFARARGALGVRVFSERDGRRSPVSHWAKQARGHVARALLLVPEPPRDAPGVRDAVNDYLASTSLVTATGAGLVMTAELGTGSLDIVVR